MNSKTTAMTLRVTPAFKSLVDRAAKLEQRSRTNLIEKLVVDHCRTLGLEADPVKANDAKTRIEKEGSNG